MKSDKDYSDHIILLCLLSLLGLLFWGYLDWYSDSLLEGLERDKERWEEARSVNEYPCLRR